MEQRRLDRIEAAVLLLIRRELTCERTRDSQAALEEIYAEITAERAGRGNFVRSGGNVIKTSQEGPTA